jgi:hypothetical protein
VLGVGLVTDEASSRAVDAALNEVTASLADHRVGYYSNFVEEPTDAHRFFDEPAWARLRRAKHAYDPTDVIRGNHPVPLPQGRPLVARRLGRGGRPVAPQLSEHLRVDLHYMWAA